MVCAQARYDSLSCIELERALNGELIEIVHKNRTIRLAPTEPKSKMACLGIAQK